MGQVLITTPVRPDQAEALGRYLAQLPRDAPPPEGGPHPVARSPFTGVLPPTHFARLATVQLDGRPHLLFSSRFDGSVTDYLRAVAATEQAVAIWSHCQLDGDEPEAIDRARLERYLCDPRHHCDSQYVVSAFPAAVTVGEVNAALTLRSQVSRFAASAADLDQWALAHGFRQLPAIRRLMDRT